MFKRLIFFSLFYTLNLLASQHHNHNKMFQTVKAQDATLVKKNSSKYFCDSCGMNLVKFYKTSHVIILKNGKKKQYCSLHCLANVYEKVKNDIKKIEVVDVVSLKLINAKKAFYVVGSSVKGTMSKVSKYAFLHKKDAILFKKEHKGEIKTFNEALKIAISELPKDNMMVKKNRKKMAKRGKIIYTKMCKKTKIPKFNYIGEVKKFIINNNICQGLTPMMLQAVSIYKFDPSLVMAKIKRIKVPANEKCPVCGMYVGKYPKWAAKIEMSKNKSYYFDGVKDMLKFYFNPKKFLPNVKKQEIKQLKVSDYYSLEEIDAKKAYYVVGSNIYGPMGEEFIPFKRKNEAIIFKENHHGKHIFTFDEIKEEML